MSKRMNERCSSEVRGTKNSSNEIRKVTPARDKVPQLTVYYGQPRHINSSTRKYNLHSLMSAE